MQKMVYNIFKNKSARFARPTWRTEGVLKVSMSSRAQVWVETVVYTLIGLAVIGILLSVSKPKIEAMKDKILIEQTVESLNEINSKIYDVQLAPGNKRTPVLKVSKGKFYVNATKNEIGWILDSSYQYSELNQLVRLGGLYVMTKGGNPYLVTVSMNYTVNLTYDGIKQERDFDSSPTPYTVTIENKGIPSGSNVINVDLKVS